MLLFPGLTLKLSAISGFMKTGGFLPVFLSSMPVTVRDLPTDNCGSIVSNNRQAGVPGQADNAGEGKPHKRLCLSQYSQ